VLLRPIRPLLPGLPILLFESNEVEVPDEGTLDGGRMVMFVSSPGICGRALPPSLLYFEELVDDGVPEPGRGGGIATGRSRGLKRPLDGGGIAVLDPNDERFCWGWGVAPGPVGRLSPVNPAVEAYRPPVGIGRNVGVAGRDEGVGMELDVAVVLRLAPDSRDWGRRRPVGMVL